MPKTFVFRDDNQVIREGVVNPTCIYDTETETAIRFLEFEEAVDYMQQSKDAYRKINAPQLADALIVFELPHDQSEIDKALTHMSYPKTLFAKFTQNA